MKDYTKNLINRRQILIAVFLMAIFFAISILLGYLNAQLFPEESMLKVKELYGKVSFAKSLSSFQLFLFIFLNNSIKAFFIVFLGIFFGVIPLMFIFINGEIIGLIVSIMQKEIGLKFVILLMLPHGILEIPAIILSAGYGLWLGYLLYRKLRFKDLIRPHLRYAMRKYFSLILPLLFLAAIIETIVTPQFAQFLK